ncbi:hypothetical protein ABID65_008273 [Bradyrhizobium sp. S3.9.2]|uniref:hypothetical protein n=1 Tax=Bradyrhizobium TaxID=374 RepID=UPI001FD90A57|nr:hypothetical protein [Bradyrhizobium japonicum]
MTENAERLRATMEMVLEETCRGMPNGGDHASRRIVAERLIEAARAGHRTLGELNIVARKTVVELRGGEIVTASAQGVDRANGGSGAGAGGVRRQLSDAARSDRASGGPVRLML